MTIVYPVTTSKRDWPFHVPITEKRKPPGFMMVERAKSVDFHCRGAKHIEGGKAELLSEMLSILDACIYLTANRVAGGLPIHFTRRTGPRQAVH